MEEKFQPKNLDEAVDHLISNLVLTDENIKFLEGFKDDERGFLGEIHHFYGRNLRNDWGLWWQKDWVENTTPQSHHLYNGSMIMKSIMLMICRE